MSKRSASARAAAAIQAHANQHNVTITDYSEDEALSDDLVACTKSPMCDNHDAHVGRCNQNKKRPRDDAHLMPAPSKKAYTVSSHP